MGFIAIMLGIFFAAVLTGCTHTAGGRADREAAAQEEIASRWGVHLEGVRLTASGHLVDFRFRVLDPDKAENLMRRGEEAYLIDQASGVRLAVPLTKVGQLRGTGTKPTAGRVYAVMFNSGGGIVRQGSAVTVVLGQFRAENLVVE